MVEEKPEPKLKRPRPSTLLQQLAAAPETLFNKTFRKQYGAICFRRTGENIEILIITSRDSGRWIMPKGWPIKGKKPHETALVEASEEAGVNGKVRKAPVGSYTYLKDIEDGGLVPCVVEMFQVEVKEIRAKFKERGQRSQLWVTPDEAARRVREIELKSLLVNFKPK